MKERKQLYLSVEGETEQWYFQRLQNIINQSESRDFNIQLQIKIQKSPLKYAKSIALPFSVEAFHVCDYESNDEPHAKQFEQTLEELKKAKSLKRNISYKLGYSNYTFELWMILHKMQYLKSLAHRTKYVDGINRAYDENFQFIDDYKEESNFKRVLSKIELADVKRAISNANGIRKFHEESGHTLTENYGFKYCKDNPDLTINQCVEKILRACGLL